MAEHGFFSHDSYNGSPFWARIKPKYGPLPGRSRSVSENLAWAVSELTADEAIQMWLHCSPHRKDLFAPAWRDVGLGAVHALGALGVYKARDVTILTADSGRQIAALSTWSSRSPVFVVPTSDTQIC